MRATCNQEDKYDMWKKWTVRLDGFFIAVFWREKTARKIAMNIENALGKKD